MTTQQNKLFQFLEDNGVSEEWKRGLKGISKHFYTVYKPENWIDKWIGFNKPEANTLAVWQKLSNEWKLKLNRHANN